MSQFELSHASESGAAFYIDIDALEPGGQRVKLRLTGTDRVRYLNGQVSQDVRKLQSAPGSSALAACVMNAKGKMNAWCRLHATSDALFLDADSEALADEFREALAMRLERYIIADDVELADVTDDWAIYFLLGPEAQWASLLPSEESEAQWRRTKRLGLSGIDLIVPAAKKETWSERLSAVGKALSAAEAETLRIRLGAPRWGAELTENTLPAEAGLDADAIDFHKGCYIGQEIVSRIKSVGRVNRRLVALRAQAPLAVGMSIVTGEQNVVGNITSATALQPDGLGYALGYLRRGTAPEATLFAQAEGANGVSIPVELREESSIS